MLAFKTVDSVHQGARLRVTPAADILPELRMLADEPEPTPGPHEVLVDIKAIGVNRADVFQREGLYPLRDPDPATGFPGDSRIPGVEIAGVITKVGDKVSKWKVGDKVCSITPYGGAYTERMVLPEFYPLKMPGHLSFEEAASLPMGLATSWHNLIDEAGLKKGDKLLIHGGSSGMGTIAIQLGIMRGAEVYATVGNPEGVDMCRRLGATPILYKEQNFEESGPFDVIMDIVGGPYFERNVRALKPGGHLRIISFLKGKTVPRPGAPALPPGPPGTKQRPDELSLGSLLTKCEDVCLSKGDALQLAHDGGKGEGDEKVHDLVAIGQDGYPYHPDNITIGSDTLRRLGDEANADLTKALEEHVMPHIISPNRDEQECLVGVPGKIMPVIHYTCEFTKERIDQAHRDMTGPHWGKLVLVRRDDPGAAKAL